MRLATVEQSRRIDERSQKEHDLSAETLMEGAGAAAAAAIPYHFPLEFGRGKIAVLCGGGHNGGDGLVVARWLKSMGRDVGAFLAVPAANCAPLTRKQIARAEKADIAIGNLSEITKWKEYSLVVDAIFGIGLSKPVEGKTAQAILALNQSRVPVVSLDVPSGLDADRGRVLGAAVKAKVTLSFGLPKPGFFVREGPDRAGRVQNLPISFPRSVVREEANTHFLFGSREAKRFLPARKATSNKAKHGHTFVIAGSEGTWGAALLAARGAYRVGSGYVTVASFEDSSAVLEHAPEILTKSASALSIDPKFSYAVGPGLGQGEHVARLIEELQRKKCPRVVLDADALNAIAAFKMTKLPKSWILTPHAGELARLVNADSSELDSDPFGWAVRASEKLGASVLFKGFHSILASNGKCLVISSGNAALAKAGTGDVLTGMISGYMAQGLESTRAAALGAFLHGRTADDWLRGNRDIRTMVASDILELMPSTVRNLAESRGY